MVDFNTSANLPINIGWEQSSTSNLSVGKLKAISPEDFGTRASSGYATDFASAIYGDGPYSLEHPNNTTDFVAQNFDSLA